MLIGWNSPLFEQKVAAHAQVDEQIVVRQAQNEILGAACDLFDLLPSDPFSKLSGGG